jgi:TonB-linked SusC/RagA family outer membrane protein
MTKRLLRCLWLISLLTGWGYQMAFAQGNVIRGKVTSAEDGSQLPGVSVLLKSTNKGTSTNINGEYQLIAGQGMTFAGTTLIFSSIGYTTQEVKIGSQTTVDVRLQVATTNFEKEVVITALNIPQEKKAIGYSVQNVTAKTIQESGEQNVVSALQGKIAGAIITGSGGAPGAGTNIILRGITSLSSGSNNQPLFIIDGIVISNSTSAGTITPSAGSNAANANEQFSNTNRSADINPDDIESLSVLKGPAATALYGLRASNGAIIITTKRGKSGKLNINLNASVGIDNVAKTPAIQTRFIQGRLGEYIAEDDPGQRSIFRSFGPAIAGTKDKIYNNFRDFYTMGVRQNYNLSISKGTEKGNIYFSLGRSYQDGIVPNSNFERNSAKLAGMLNISKKFQVSASINYIQSGGRRANSGDKSPFTSLSYWPNSYDVNDYTKPDGSQNNITLGVVDNPRYLVEKSPRIDDIKRWIADITLKYDITSWLTAKYQITADTYQENRSRFVDSTFDVGTQVKGWMIKDHLTYQEINSNLFLTAAKKFNENWHGSLMIGNSVVDAQNPDAYWQRGERWIAPFIQDISSFKNYSSLPYSPNHYRIVSGFADAKLNYRDILYLNVTGRNDMVSTLPVQNNSFFYPSVNLSYVFTEHFLKNNPILSFGKLRLSWAEVGKGTSPYVTGAYFSPASNFPYGGTVDGYIRSSLTANPNLKPERTASTEVGAELRFFRNRLVIDGTYFTMDSKDQIVNAPVTNASGYSNYYTNIGLIRNKGIELMISGKPVVSKNFTWESSINWSKLEGTVVEMPSDLKEIVYYDNVYTQLKVVQGSKLGDLWGYDYKRSPDGKVILGTNGFPTVDLSKSVVMGNALPNWQAGWNNTFVYKNFSLSCLLEWRQGGSVVDLAEQNSVRNGVTKLTERRYEQVTFNGVTETKNADGTFSYATNTKQVFLDDNFYRSSTQFYYWGGFTIQDGSWIRVRNVNVGYALPKGILAKSPFSMVRFTLTGTNLFLNTPFRGYDPEALGFGSGSNLVGYVGRNTPSTRSFQFGVSLSLK